MHIRLSQLFFILLSSLLLACKKDKTTPVNLDLQRFAAEVKIQPIWIYGNKAMMSFLEYHNQKDIQSVLEMKSSAEKDWQKVNFTDKNNILLNTLKPRTTYHLRVALSKGSETQYSKIDSFTTLDYYLNPEAFFEAAAGLYDSENGFMTVEGAQMMVKGGGFSTMPEIKVLLTNLSNSADRVSINATILNDSTLRIDIPNDLLSNTPYIVSKTYGCAIGSLALVGQKSFTEGNYFVQANLTVLNKDMSIQKISVEKLACAYVSVEGYFGNHSKGTCPNYIWGVTGKVKERKLIIRDASGGVVKEVLVLAEGMVNCDAEAVGLVDIPQISRSLPSWHELLRIGFRTSLSTGAYTLEVQNVGYDAMTYHSNVLPFEI